MPIFFSFDIDSINSAYCPGVSCPSVIGGLSEEEAYEISFLAGSNKNVYIMDVFLIFIYTFIFRFLNLILLLKTIVQEI